MANIRRLVIFGATGNTGLCCTEAAVQLGYDTTVFIRDPAKLPEPLASQVTVKVGDILDEYQVDDAVQGQDAVVIVIGTRNDLSPTTMMSEGTKNVLSAMEKYNVNRVSACLSSFNFWEREKVPERFLNILDDHSRMLEALKASSREWVAVLPPHITGEPAKGDYITAQGKGPGRTISKHDLGHFMVTCLTDDDNLHKMIGLCDKPQA
ncbi:flavin reductase (NADPH)-like isoform X2 [Penaeus chinensis]|uniref:flavin reductase (NADPH)-like isoform X2 n=1 Tax=Penaeus chinensis TaxID=139456 RepID=UPI001FB600E4|nr:flavin reductase (NADPH)-like isoform X2 [Penaeus chinensis]